MTTDPRTCVVTGAGSGIGAAVAKTLSAAGIRCALVDLFEGTTPQLAASEGSAKFFKCDVADESSVREAADAIEHWSGPITSLVTAAGIAQTAIPSTELSREDWHRVMSVNLDGTLFWCQVAAQSMIAADSGGAIATISSVSGRFGWPRRLAYSTSKAAVEQVTRTLAVEWAPHRIRVNAIAPGYTETPLVKDVFNRGTADRQTTQEQHAMDRLGEPEEMAAAAKFLLSDDASFITGQTLCVDGGFSVLKAR